MNTPARSYHFRRLAGDVAPPDAWRMLDATVARWVLAHGGSPLLARIAGWASHAEGHGDSALLLDGEAADDLLRGTQVTQAVSKVAVMPGARAWVNDQVRAAARTRDVVVDGRDMGTAVFPDAELKVFLVADPWERARRRLIQRLGRQPSDEEIAVETELIVKRDAKDATQTVQATDAVLIDTTFLTQEDQVERIVALAKAVGGSAMSC